MKARLLTLMLFLLWQSPLAAQDESKLRVALQLLEQTEETSNVVLSPFSLQSAFAMAAAGARGQTEQEIVGGLALGDNYVDAMKDDLRLLASDGAEISVANRLWPSRAFKLEKSYVSQCLAAFGAEPQGLDFGQPEVARQTINTWISEKTKGKVPELLPAGMLDPSVVLVMTNALYFKGSWEAPFPPGLTSTETFHSPKGDLEVAMMHHRQPHAYFENAELQAVVLPYRDSSVAMTVLLPRQVDGWKTLRQNISPRLLQTIAKVEMDERAILVEMPRFKLNHRLAVIPSMRKLGIKQAFGGSADFSKMARGEMFIGDAAHEATVEVDEAGTVGAAATSIMISRGNPTAAHTVRMDHPFLFVISDTRTGAVLFVGQVLTPDAADAL